MQVSVIIPAHNAALTLPPLLTALQSQVFPLAQREILVVNSNSTDETASIAAAFPVRLLHASRPGPGAARNVGLAAAQGKIIAYLDADMLPTRRWLHYLVVPFADPEVQLVGGRTFSYKPVTPAERFISRQMEAFAWTYYFSRRVFPFVASRNLAVRRQAALSVGGWNEGMPTAEDMDFCYRLGQRYGCKPLAVEDAVAFHRDRATDRELRDQAWHYGQGLAHMYALYPSASAWHPAKAALVAGLLILRAIQPGWWRLLGRPAADIEFAHYHRCWSLWYWRGFFAFRRSGRRSAPPPWSEARPAEMPASTVEAPE